MEKIPYHPILKFHSDTFEFIRHEYNLDKPGQMDAAVDILDDWVRKQAHFTKKEFPREYLERIIILLKGSVERAKGQLDKICTLRTLLPQFFEKCDAKNDFKILKGLACMVLFPKLTKDHTRVFFMRFKPVKFTSKFFLHVYLYTVLICEHLKANDYSNGMTLIFDIRGVNIIEMISQLNLIELKQICTIFLEGYDTRARNFLFLSSSKAIDLFIKIFKQMISEKLGQRIRIFKEVEEFYEYVPKDMFPSDYGGNEKSSVELHDELMDFLSSKENVKYFREMSQARTEESLRTSRNYSEDFSGLAGTFRTLSVD